MRKHKKLKWILAIVLTLLIVLVFSLNFVVSKLADRELRDLLAKKSTNGYNLSYDHIRVNMLNQSVILKGIQISPDSSLMAEYKRHAGDAKNLFALHIPTLRLEHINVISALGSKIVDLRGIVFSHAVFTIYTGGGNPEKNPIHNKQLKRGLNLENIAIKGIGGIDIASVVFDDFSLLVVNPIKGDTVLHNTGFRTELDDLHLIKNSADSSTYRLGLKDMRFDVENERFNLGGSKYELSFQKFSFEAESRSVQIDELQVKPKQNKYKMAASFQYRADVYDVAVQRINLKFGDIKEMLLHGNWYLPYLAVDGLDLKILRNRSLPFDESKRPLLPNELLKKMKANIDVDSLLIRNSTLVYEESNNDGHPAMVVTLNKLSVDMQWITSIADSMLASRPMTVGLKAMLENQIPLDVMFNFPLHSRADTFSYSGRLGKGNLSVFNPILQSAAGVNFSSGELQGISFAVEANNTYAMGTMTMLYSNLKGEVMKKESGESNRLFSWVANQVIKTDNPNQGEKPRVVPVFFARDLYKGMGNFSFKPLLSGVLATTIPTFDKSNQRHIDIIRKTTKKDIRRRKRADKRE